MVGQQGGHVWDGKCPALLGRMAALLLGSSGQCSRKKSIGDWLHGYSGLGVAPLDRLVSGAALCRDPLELEEDCPLPHEHMAWLRD